MAYAMFSDPVNGVSEVMLRRESANKIIITTAKPMTDDQMTDLYWTVSAMSRTGLTLHELMMDRRECEDD